MTENNELLILIYLASICRALPLAAATQYFWLAESNIGLLPLACPPFCSVVYTIVQAEFQRWLAEREANKKTRVAKTATLVSVMGNKQIIRTRFQFGRYGSDYFALAHRKGLVCIFALAWDGQKLG